MENLLERLVHFETPVPRSYLRCKKCVFLPMFEHPPYIKPANPKWYFTMKAPNTAVADSPVPGHHVRKSSGPESALGANYGPKRHVSHILLESPFLGLTPFFHNRIQLLIPHENGNWLILGRDIFPVPVHWSRLDFDGLSCT